MMMHQRIWDPLLRLFHWSVAIAFLMNFIILEEGETAHRWVGYYVLSALVVRFIWGFLGSQNARFKDFLPTPSGVKHHLTLLSKKQFESSNGHNPLGGLMIFALLLGLLLTGLSGWMMGIDVFWGEEWVEELHELLASMVMTFVIIHVAVVVVLSFVGPSNLIKQMITGYRSDRH
ncbi:MAG: cytochrome b/b6 domain-containing protein [Psychromonas sp.]